MSSVLHSFRTARGLYPERVVSEESRFDETVISFLGSATNWLFTRPGRFNRLAHRALVAGEGLVSLSDGELQQQIGEVRQTLQSRGFTTEAMVRAFALVREVSGRRLGKYHYPVQLMGGFVLLHGMVAEMQTGEGKTLTATLPACTAALAGIRVHVITVNDYLAKRDAELMMPVYEAFGLSVGVVIQGISPEERRRAYACNVTYCTNKDVVFDYLKDRLVVGQQRGHIQMRLHRLMGTGSYFDKLLMSGLPYAIVDEADSVLVDEARTPLIISGPGGNPVDPVVYGQTITVVRQLVAGEDFLLDLPRRRAELTAKGKERIELLSTSFGGIWGSSRWRDELGHQALSALYLFNRDEHYIAREGKIEIVDEYTGRIMPDRSWERGLHQLIEAKEGCDITQQNETLARISYQRFFRRYCHLAGMSGTLREVAKELWDVYRLRVVTIPPNRPVIRQARPYSFTRAATEKWQVIVERIRQEHQQGRPVLVGTRSVASSELLSALLRQADLPHQVLNARQDKEEAAIVAEAGKGGRIMVATNMAGRGTDIHIEREVALQGGLHVIATELHDTRRIDRQLFGRCGRQGDPGSFEAVVSLEDELYQSLRTIPLAWQVVRWIMGGDSRVHYLLALFLTRFAQWRIQRRNFQVRRQLLHMDEQLESSLAFAGRGE